MPGHRQRVLARHAALVDSINAAISDLEFGQDGRDPWLHAKSADLKVFGFATEPANLRLLDAIRPVLIAEVPSTHFRLLKDYVTRWMYPHMRPDIAPEGYQLGQLDGMHGQHKDAIRNLPDGNARERLNRAFTPGLEDVVLDCGAFIGLGAVRMGRDAPQGRVIAVEASAECYALLERNVRENRARNVTPVHKGVWNTKTELALETSYAQGNSLVDEMDVGAKRKEAVETATIDGLIEEFGLRRLDMISLTLNGAEVEAIQGARQTLTRLRPRIRAAGWYARAGRSIADILREELASYDYDVFVGRRNNFMALPREDELRPGNP